MVFQAQISNFIEFGPEMAQRNGAEVCSTRVREFFLEDGAGAGFRNPSFAELCNFLRKRGVIHKRPNPGTMKIWQKMGREIAVLSYPTY